MATNLELVNFLKSVSWQKVISFGYKKTGENRAAVKTVELYDVKFDEKSNKYFFFGYDLDGSGLKRYNVDNICKEVVIVKDFTPRYKREL